MPEEKEPITLNLNDGQNVQTVTVESQEIKDVKKKKGRGRPKKNTLKCDICGKFVNKTYMKKHIETQHGKHEEKTVLKEEKKTFPENVVNKINDMNVLNKIHDFKTKNPEKPINKSEKALTDIDKKLFRESEGLRSHVESPKTDFMLKLIIAGGAIITVIFIIGRFISIRMGQNSSSTPSIGPVDTSGSTGYYVDNDGRVYSPGEYHHG